MRNLPPQRFEPVASTSAAGSSSTAASSSRSRASRRPVRAADDQVGDSLARIAAATTAVEGSTTLDGLEIAIDTLKWRLESNSHELAVLLDERRVQLAKIASLQDARHRLALQLGEEITDNEGPSEAGDGSAE